MTPEAMPNYGVICPIILSTSMNVVRSAILNCG